jgi:Flp pilus assembly protein TadG
MLIYTVIALVPLTGICSMAVDFGRVEAAKTELLAASDAAARAGAFQLSPGSNSSTNLTNATSTAATIFSGNSVDGHTLTLGSNGLTATVGSWSGGVFTAGSNASSNAVQITVSYTVPLIWGQVIGVNNCQVHETSVATATSGVPPYGVVGINSMLMNNPLTISSYNAQTGVYSQNAGVASNGTWTIGSGIAIDGNLYYNSSVSSAPTGGTVTGSRQTIPSGTSLTSLYPPVTTPSSATNEGNYNGGNLTLSAGSYSYTNFTLNASDTLTVSGKVQIYVNGNININGNVNVGGLPANCQIYNVSSSGINIGGSGEICAELYGPNSPVNFNTSGSLYGELIGSQISVGTSGSSAHIYIDTSSGIGGSGLTTVQMVK